MSEVSFGQSVQAGEHFSNLGQGMSRPPEIPSNLGSPVGSLLYGASDRYIDSERDEKGYSLGYSSEAMLFLQHLLFPRQMRLKVARPARTGSLHQIWSQRDPRLPELCFDRYEGRPSVVLYTTPRRLPGGKMMPCALSTSKQNECGSAKAAT